MGVRVLAYRIGLFILLREIQYTRSQMNQEPLAANYHPIFTALRTEWNAVLAEEIGILDELSQGQAAVNKADRHLDGFAGRVSRAVDDNTDGKTRKQIRLALFKNKPLSRFRRPVLSSQLVAMDDWSDTLTKCGVAVLVGMGAEAATLVSQGEVASVMRAKAQQKNRDFRDIGARKQFIDKVNAARQEAFGGLGKLPFQNPALPQDFAEGFFYSEAPPEEEETIDEVKTSISDLEGQLVERQALLTQLEDEAAKEAATEAEKKALLQSAEDLEAQAEELLKQAAAAKAKAKK